MILESEGTLILMIVRRRVAVFWTAFCTFFAEALHLGQSEERIEGGIMIC